MVHPVLTIHIDFGVMPRAGIEVGGWFILC